jgi:hypothetical protein
VPAAAYACAGGDIEIEGETFFSPEVLGRPNLSPFFFTPHYFYGYGVGQAAPDFAQVNLDEWDAFFQKKLPSAAWSELLYKAPLPRLDNLIFALQKKAGVTPAPADAPFMGLAEREQLISALFYVGFAKRVEPIALEHAEDQSWAPKKKVDAAARNKTVQSLIDGGLKAFAAAKNPFLRERYAFQLVRLYFYQSDYAKCLKFYEENRALFGNDSAGRRAMGFAAGAHFKTKKTAEANYLYSILFDQYEPMKVSAFWSFHPRDEASWKQTLALAKTPHEKEVLWQMLGISADGLRAMKEIYALNPKSELLSLLVVREINRNEQASFNAPDKASSAKLVSKPLVAFMEGVATKGDTAEPYLWDMAVGQLHAISGDSAEAKRALDRAATRAPKTELVQTQIRASKLLAMISGLKSVTPADEAALAPELTWLKGVTPKGGEANRLGTLLEWSKRRLSTLLRAGGNVVMALCLDDRDDPLYLDPTKLDQMAAFLNKPSKSPFEAFVAGSYAHPAANLQEDKALLAMYGGDVEKAATLFAGVKTTNLNADPFVIHVKDCHDCDATAQHKTYSKAEFATRMAELIKQAASTPAKAPALYFEVANGFYNMSFYGNSRFMYATEDYHFKASPLISDQSKAKEYYKKAFDLSTDREFKAKAAFMSAKVELNEYYLKNPDKETFQSGQWFRTLKDSLSDTRYYKEVLKECGYFQTFVSSAKKR